MNPSPEVTQQIASAYARMARVARYRPSAPSDGFGNVQVDEEQLNVSDEQARYVEQWWTEEQTDSYWVGVPNYVDRHALIYIIEAARTLNGGNPDVTARLLKMALAEVGAEG